MTTILQYIKERPLRPLLLLMLILLLLISPLFFPHSEELVNATKAFEKSLIEPLRLFIISFGILGLLVNCIKLWFVRNAKKRKNTFNTAITFGVFTVITIYVPAIFSFISSL